MNNLFVKKGDNVKLLAGKNKGKTGKVLSVDPETNKVVVDGWNVIVKHVKAKNAQSAGGIQKAPGQIDASNVQIICPACSYTTRVGSGTDTNGKKIRICKKCGASLEVKQKTDKKAKKSKKDEAAAEEKPVKKTKVKAEEKTEAAAPVAEEKKKADDAVKAEKPAAKKAVKKTDDK